MSDYDGLHLCEDCGDAYTLGRFCTSCAQQRSIDATESVFFYPEDEVDPCADGDHDWVEVNDGMCYECRRCGLIDC